MISNLLNWLKQNYVVVNQKHIAQISLFKISLIMASEEKEGNEAVEKKQAPLHKYTHPIIKYTGIDSNNTWGGD